MKAIYELEQRIMSCWQAVDDMKSISGDGLRELDADSMRSILKGMQLLYDLRFDALFDTYSAALKESHEETVAQEDEASYCMDDTYQQWDGEYDRRVNNDRRDAFGRDAFGRDAF